LGGGGLTHASDLDLIYLFEGDIGASSDGPRPLTASLYFNRLAQRVTAALSVPTAEGALYQVDTRLRPQGAQGPLPVRLESFERYQRENAWPWEHMALCRARAVLGSTAGQERLSNVVRDVLGAPRDGAILRRDVLAMRSEIGAHKIPSGPLDAKLLRGGLVDCEFIVHFLQLRDRIAFRPSLEQAIAELVAAGRLPPAFAERFALLARLLVAARLLAPDGRYPSEAAQAVLARACGQDDFTALLGAVHEARQGVADCWAEVFGEPIDIKDE